MPGQRLKGIIQRYFREYGATRRNQVRQTPAAGRRNRLTGAGGLITGRYSLCRIIAFSLLAWFSLQPARAETPPAPAAGPLPVFVSTDWLASRLGQPELVVLQVAPVIREYRNGHIPGARFLWPGWLSISTPEISVEPPPVKALQKTLRELGITNRSRVVLCGANGNIVAVCRMFVTLEYAGLAGRAAILDGGLNLWQAEGRPVTREPSRFRKGNITLRPDRQVMAGTEWLSQNLGNPAVTIIDARSAPFYEGKSGLPRPGHLPGALNIPSASCYEPNSNKFVTREKLSGLFPARPLSGGNQLVTYCFVGNAASVVYAVARQLGYPVRLHDGSMEEWGSIPELPLVIPVPPAENGK